MNRDSLDNHAGNLRVASKRTQIINQNIQCKFFQKNSVTFDNKKKNWRATWVDAEGNNCTKSFSVNHRKYIEQFIPHYVEALIYNISKNKL
jgi:hypothetical protein